MSNDITNLLPADTDALLAELKQQAERSKRLSRLYVQISILCFVSQILNISRILVSKGSRAEHWIFALLMLTYGSLIALGGVISHDRRKNKERRRTLIRALESDVRAIGPLLLFIHEKQDRYIKDRVYEVLTTLLPRLKSSDERLLTSEQQDALVDMLKLDDEHLKYREPKLAAIRALQQVGDERAIAPMRSLFHGGSFNSEVRAAARECLPFLETNAANRGQSYTLLRASESASATPEILLRPAAATQTDAGQEVLLRSVE